MPAGLAGLQLDEVQNFVLALQQEIVEAQKDAGASGEGSCRPAGCAPRASATARSTSASVRPGYLASTPPVKEHEGGDLTVRSPGQGHLRRSLPGSAGPIRSDSSTDSVTRAIAYHRKIFPPKSSSHEIDSHPNGPNLQAEFPVLNSMEKENMDPKSPEPRQRLSGTDAAFLYLERKEIPLHIACVSVFEEAIPYEEFVATIDSKLHLLPRYRQLAVNPPFGIGYPNWEYDQHFDIRRHIIRITVNAPGDEDALEDLAGRIFSVVMSREKPLWEIYVVEGLQGGRGALIAKVHHALADGIAGASLLRIMLDPTAEGSHAIRKPHFQPPAPNREPSLTDAIASAIHSSLENLVAAEAGLLDIAQGLVSERGQQGLQGLVTLLPEIATPVQRLPFNRQCGGERKFCWAEFDFADVKAIRNVTGGTVNDVILTVVTRAVAQYVKLHGESVAGRFVRMVCPVSVRKDEQGDSLGNRISFLPVTLPLELRTRCNTSRRLPFVRRS